MGVMDEFKVERNRIRQGTPREKLQYFWDYYKGYVIIGLVMICILVSMDKLSEIYPKTTEPMVLAVAANAPRDEMIAEWIAFLVTSN